jgi:uncharacterized phage protein gp47/JayE
MVARVIARGGLSALRKNSGIYHVLASASDEDAEQYFQLARLRDVFSIDSATGSDLDERAAEVETDETLLRIAAQKATTLAQFSRPGTVGTVAIASGSVVAASDALGTIRFRTTAAGSITGGNTTSALIPVIAETAGVRGNIAAGALVRMETRIAGVTGVTNPAAATTGKDQESDPDFRARIKQHVQRMSRGTVFAIDSYARATTLDNGQRVLFTRVVEPINPNGSISCYVDDGTGATDVYSSDFITADDTLIATAVGGEFRFRTAQRPIRDDGSFALRKNGVLLVRNTDYAINSAGGDVELFVALSASQNLKANYRYYTGLVQEAQKVIDGDKDDRQNYPGVRAGANRVYVLPPTRVLQSVTGQLSVFDDYDLAAVTAEVKTAVQNYINGLDIGAYVLVANIIKVVMGVAGVENFSLSDLSGSSPAADQIVLPAQVARIISASISIL